MCIRDRLIEIAGEENDSSVLPEIQKMLGEFTTELDALRLRTLLTGEYDGNNAILRLNAGAGGTESCDWCSMLYRMYSRWAESHGFSTSVLDYLEMCIRDRAWRSENVFSTQSRNSSSLPE